MKCVLFQAFCITVAKLLGLLLVFRCQLMTEDVLHSHLCSDTQSGASLQLGQLSELTDDTSDNHTDLAIYTHTDENIDSFWFYNTLPEVKHSSTAEKIQHAEADFNPGYDWQSMHVPKMFLYGKIKPFCRKTSL